MKLFLGQTFHLISNFTFKEINLSLEETMFANILSTTLMALSVGAIFTAAAPATLAAATFIAGFSIISWGMERHRG